MSLIHAHVCPCALLHEAKLVKNSCYKWLYTAGSTVPEVKQAVITHVFLTTNVGKFGFILDAHLNLEKPVDTDT